ncbi:hypothetical protein BC937DRAFT_89808 [Endogone sp. FLAS-F59071]|nr:hypothetical protein BC937DRAFT_89808 [Endogone sp. FLAS-F59071]|eukprot:RUS17564.1 hypothetical protein BC937DRAFT_89808 [Endogone sp. FLAS-F59071]
MSAADWEYNEGILRSQYTVSPNKIRVNVHLLDGKSEFLEFNKTDQLTQVYNKLDGRYNPGGELYALKLQVKDQEIDLTDQEDGKTLEDLLITTGSILIMTKMD